MARKYTEGVTVRFEPELHAQLKRLAQQEDRSVAGLIRKLARDLVAREE